MMKNETLLAHKLNYGGKRTKPIEYIVIHYTANNGDSAKNNALYFQKNVKKTSAHIFVDDEGTYQSVPYDYVAYAVGGYYGGGSYYKKCSNDNSISIELCDQVKDDNIYPTKKTIDNAIELVKFLMQVYNIPADHVIRHYDVNGKQCPKYWTDDALWKSEFHDKLSTKKSTQSTKYMVVRDCFVRKYAGKTKLKFADIKESFKKHCHEDAKGYAVFNAGGIYSKTDEKVVSNNKWYKCKTGYWLPQFYNGEVISKKVGE